MKAVWQDSAGAISLGEIDVLSHVTPISKGWPSSRTSKSCWQTIQVSSSKRVKISNALSTLIPGRSSKTCLWGSGLEFPKHEVPDQKS